MLTAHVSSTQAFFTQGLDCSFFSGGSHWSYECPQYSPVLPPSTRMATENVSFCVPMKILTGFVEIVSDDLPLFHQHSCLLIQHGLLPRCLASRQTQTRNKRPVIHRVTAMMLTARVGGQSKLTPRFRRQTRAQLKLSRRPKCLVGPARMRL
jgi:hypothetical protein